MYGKIFGDIYGSSLMVHGGDTVYVFISMIVLSDAEGFLREHASAFANRIGKDLVAVQQAIRHLEAPDAESSSPDHDGKRIVSLRELTGGEENRGWLVVNKKKYKFLASKEDQREATKHRVRKHRYRNAPVTTGNASVTHRNGKETVGNASNAIQIQIQNKTKNICASKNDALIGFEKFWWHYPKRKSKVQAEKAWKKLQPDEQLQDRISHALERAKKSEDWIKQGGQFVPYPASWINQRRWEDDDSAASKRPGNPDLEGAI